MTGNRNRGKKTDGESVPMREDARTGIAPRRARSSRSRLFQAGLAVAVAVFALLSVLAKRSAFFPADLWITRTMQSFDGAMTAAMEAVSWAGAPPQSYLLVAAAALTLVFLRMRWEACAAALAAAAEELLNFLVKLAIHRPRPPTDLVHVLITYTSYSFPSGHVMFYTVFFGFLWYLSYMMLRRSCLRSVLLAAFGAEVLLIGVSRVYLGEHWASDALGAYLLGGLVLIAAIRFYQWGKPRFFAGERS